MNTQYTALVLEPRPFAATLHELRDDLRTRFQDYCWPAAWVQEDPSVILEGFEFGAAVFEVHEGALPLFEIVAKTYGFEVWS